MVTKKLYDINAYQTKFTATVLSCIKKEAGELYEVVLNETLFFPEEGGQTPDKGKLGGAEVLDVQIKDDVILHTLNTPLGEGEVINGEINWQHRFFNMQQHSGEHLFSGLVYKKYGYKNVGFHLSNQIATMDFDGILTTRQIEELEWAVNEAVAANVEIKTLYPSKEELAKLKYRSKIEIEGAVRIVEISGYDICACCAPHVKYTGEIGIFKIQSVQNYKGGVRISFLCGFRALMEFRRKAGIISELTGILTTSQEQLAENVMKLKSQLHSLKGRLSSAKQAVMESKIAEISSKQTDVLLFESDLEVMDMRGVVNKLVETHEGVCGIFVGSDEIGYNFIIGSKNVDCRTIAEMLRGKFDAKGGGSAAMVQGVVNARADDVRKLLQI